MTGSRRVLFTMTFAERLGGCEDFLWTFFRRVDRSRIQPSIVFNNRGPFIDEVAALGVPVAVIETGALREVHREVVAIARLTRLLRRERPDLVVSWFTKAQLYTSPAAILAGLRDRIVWFQHTLPGGTDLDPFATALPAKAIGACSEAGARAQARIWPHRPTFAVAPGIDEPAAAPEEELRELRSSLGIPSERRIVGIVGRMQPWKQHHLVVEAVARLRADGVDAHGLIVGGIAYERDPDYYPYVQQLVERDGLGDAITFTDQVANAHPYIQLMDVLVNASSNEPFGIVLLEAMALGVPAVAFDADGGPPEILEHGEAGLLAKAGDVEDLAMQIRRILTDSGLRDRLVDRGRRRFESHYTGARMTANLEERLLALADGAARTQS